MTTYRFFKVAMMVTEAVVAFSLAVFVLIALAFAVADVLRALGMIG